MTAPRQEAAQNELTWREKYHELSAKYFELIYEVVSKHPTETRHETARRYIRERETRSGGPSEAKQNIQVGEVR